MTPSDVVTQPLQVGNSPYRGTIVCTPRDSRKENAAAFFKLYRTRVSLTRSALHAFPKAGNSLLSISLYDWGLVQATKTTKHFCSSCHAQRILTVKHW